MGSRHSFGSISCELNPTPIREPAPPRGVGRGWRSRFFALDRGVMMARYGLAKHVFVCADEEYIVVLDVKQDRYFTLEAARTAALSDSPNSSKSSSRSNSTTRK